VSDRATVRPLRPDEWETFVARATAFYVEDMVVSGGIERGVAERKAERDFAVILPDGPDTEGHFFFMVEDEGEVAGYLWLADRKGEMGHNLFVYGIEIDEDHRGRGLGRAAMEFAEAEGRRLGVPRVALNVFGGNEVARRLYASLGYRETAVHMEKVL